MLIRMSAIIAISPWMALLPTLESRSPNAQASFMSVLKSASVMAAMTPVWRPLRCAQLSRGCLVSMSIDADIPAKKITAISKKVLARRNIVQEGAGSKNTAQRSALMGAALYVQIHGGSVLMVRSSASEISFI